MLEPHCESCGGLLESVQAGSGRTPAAGSDGLASMSLAAHAPTLGPAFGRVLRIALLGLLMFAAARFGWSAGGPALALTAIGVVGLCTVPLIVGE